MLFLFSFILSLTHQHSIIFRNIVSSQISYLVTFGLAFFQLSSKSFQGYIHIPCPSFEMYFECYHFSFLYKPTTTHISVLFFFSFHNDKRIFSLRVFLYKKKRTQVDRRPLTYKCMKIRSPFLRNPCKKGTKGEGCDETTR